MSRPPEVAEGIYRLGSRYLNWYVIVDKGAVTLIDSGVPGYWPQLSPALAELGLEMASVEAVLLTHHHPDHRGNILRAHKDKGAAVYAHAADIPYVDGSKRLPMAGVVKYLWRPWYLGYIGHLVHNGVLRSQMIGDARTMEDGAILDVPGGPQVIHPPGHTPGSCALWLSERKVLMSGDALVTLDTASGRARPCILAGAFTHDLAQALDSLSKLESLKAEVMLPGHGEPWKGSVADAVRLARA